MDKYKVKRITNLNNFKSIVEEAIAKYQPIQSARELETAMALVSSIKPKVIVELGTYRGGSLRCWSACAEPDAVIAGTDTPGTPDGVNQNIQSWLLPTQRGKLFIGDLRLPQFRDEVLAYTGRPIDFLFIDAAHTREDVTRDYELWSPFVRSGGLIGFHDIKHTDVPDVLSWKFWRELTSDKSKFKNVYEIFDEDYQKAYGIGIVEKL